MRGLLHFGLLLATLLIISSCSLFKFTISMGDRPLSEADLNTRVMVRGFYNDFTRTVIAASDSIALRTDNIGYKINALRWKMRSSAACADAVYGGEPEVSLINTWVLCLRMTALMSNAPDSLLFGNQTPIARQASQVLLSKIEGVAAKYLPAEKYTKMSSFANNYSAANPMTNLNFITLNLMLEWADAQTTGDKNYIKGVGSISEVMSDMNDRVSGYTTQLGNEISWSKDMFSLEIAQDSLRDKLEIRLDSISQTFNRMVVVFENSPQIVGEITNNLSAQMKDLISALDGSVNTAFYNISNERRELQLFFDAQRGVLMAEMQQSVDMAIKTTMDSLPKLIGKITIYLVLGLTVLFCVPFFAGFMLGRWRERKKPKNEDNK